MTSLTEPAASAAGTFVDLKSLIEGRAFGRLSVFVTAWASLTMFVEGFEMQLVGYAAPAMIGALHVSKGRFGAIFGAGNFGFFLGALLLSSLGDRLGRRRLIVFGVMLFSVCTLAAGHGTTLIALSVLRFGAGIGLGGAVPNAIALTAEYAPHKNRASRITLLYVAYTVGGAGAGLLASWLIPKWGWPIVFTVGGWGGLLTGVLLYFFLPESLSFLSQRRPQDPALRQIVGRMRPGLPLLPETRIATDEAPSPRVPFMALFQEGRTAVTLLLWFSYVMGIMALQFITSWLPTLIAGTGVSISLAVLIGSLFHIGGTAGNIVVGFLMDRRGIKTIAIGFLIAVPITACMGLVSATLPLLALATLCAGVLIVGSLNGINAVSGMVYPTGMRATGAGWMNGVGRLGSIIGPVLGGILISLDMPISTLFLCLAVPVAMTAIGMAGLVYATAHASGSAAGASAAE